MSASQLVLRLALPDGATFANFEPGRNGSALHALVSGEPFIYLWGARGAGKTHLLQSVCHASAGESPAYLPLAEWLAMEPAILDGLEAAPVICVDDVQTIAGREPWERALFHLYNRVRDGGGRMIVAGDGPPGALGLGLADLVSRLGWGPVFQLHELDEQAKIAALRRRARGRGMELGEDVAVYLMRRCPRDTHSLFALLDRLDGASLTAKRRLTIPFVREILEVAQPRDL